MIFRNNKYTAMNTTSTIRIGRFFLSALFVGLFSLISFSQTFTNAGATGRFGPVQAQCDVAYGAGVVNITTQGIQEWTVPATGSYSIQAIGATGGQTNNAYEYGTGASMYGEFNLTIGDVILIVVGQQGSDSPGTWEGAGAGGGSFVVLQTGNTPLIIAAGGAGSSGSSGGGAPSRLHPGGNATFGNAAVQGIVIDAYGGGTERGGSCGGGFTLNGENGYVSTGGSSFLNGAIGGTCNYGSAQAHGGFGGGGAGDWYSCGGGAGGYQGADVSNFYAAGGGPAYAYSYNNGTNQTNSSGIDGTTNSALKGHGVVTITALCVPVAASLIPDVTPLLDATGECSVTPATPTASNSCGTNNISGTPDVAFPITAQGTTTVTWTYDDGVNSITQTQDVVITDVTNPTITCATPAANYSADAGTCAYIHTSTNLDPTTGDNCAGETAVNDFNNTATLNGATFPIGTTTVIWTVTDVGGNTATCQYDVIVVDTEAPTAVCQDINVYLDGAGTASIVAADLDGGSTDNCGTVNLSASVTSFTCANLGLQIVVLTVDDGNGNTDDCGPIVTVLDTISPTISCATPAASYDVDAGTCALAVTDASFDPAFADNCSGATIINSITGTNTLNGASFGLGTTNVVWQVTDGSANTATCNYNVVVVDNEAPVAVCQDITIQLNAAGNATIVPADIDNGSTDNCGIGGISVSPNTFTCAEVGANTVTLTVLDNAGNSTTCTSTVTVEDNVVPNAICQDITVQLDAAGNATITGADIDNGSNDNCGIASLAVAPGAFTCTELGANTVTLTVTDINGNVSTCTSTVTVEDNVAPVALCSDITVTLDAAGNATIVAADIDGGSTDNCGIASLAASITSFDCSMTGANTVTLTVTDNDGNVATCDAIVTVVDTENPAIICPGDIVVNNDAGVCGTTVNYTITATDNCGGGASNILFVSDNAAATEIPVALTAAGYSVTSVYNDYTGGGDNPTLQASLAAYDVVYWHAVGAGYGSIHNAVTFTNLNSFISGGGSVFVTGYDVIASPTDATLISFLGGTTSQDVPPGGGTGTILGPPNSLNTGVTNIIGQTLAAPGDHDALLNLAPGVIGVSVAGSGFDWTLNTNSVGDVAWVSSGQNIGAFNQWTTPGSWYHEALLNFAFNANSGPAIAQTDATGLTTGDVFPIGTTTIEYTATDDSGNEDVCSFNVIVTDNEAPVATCQPITVQLDATGNATIVAADVDGGSTDNCGIASMSIDNGAFTCANVGPNNVTLTVNDVNGNSSTCVAVVTVEDNVLPTAICQDITVVLDAAGSYTMLDAEIDNGSNDACGIASISASQTAFGCGDVGVVPVTLTVTDNNGNVSTCVANVTVEDNEAPIAACVAGGTQFFLDANGDLTMTGAMMDAGSTDNCGIASLSASPSSFTCADIGFQNVTLTVTDVNGNVSTCVSNIEIVDNIAPVITCPADITVNAIVDNCGRTVTYNFDVVDACATITQTDGTGLTSGNLFPVGTTVQSYEVTDQTGTYTCTFNVTVNDVQNPIITNCPSNIVVSTDLGSCDAGVNWTEPIASDNCPAVSFTSTHSPGDVFALGTTTVTYTATDASGNFVTCSFTVTVNDTEAPVITDCTPDITVSNDAASCDAVVTFAAPVYTENCTMGTEAASIVSGSTFPVGTTPVTWTITDAAGNASTCTFNVIVEDTELPIAVCTDFAVNLDATGNASITTGDINAGSADNCGIASLALDVTTFDCSNVGTNPVVLTVTDIHGNVSTCSATVTVNDNLAPNALCAPITVQLDATGNVSINGADIDAGSNDNCGIASLVATPSAFTCAEVGGNVVTLTVTDVNGNSSTCVTTVTVEDNVVPVAICQDITVQLDAAGVASITGLDIDNGSSDACGIASIVAAPNSFTCANVGANTVTLTVTDVNGNVSTCTSTVTIEDNVAPTIVCTDITVQLDATGNASITPLDVDGGSSDACGISLYTINGTSGIDFTCVNVGPNNVTLAVTDNNGNVSTCTAIVTVEDNVAPVISCQDITVFLDASGNATITDADVDAGSSDACGIATSVIDVAAFDCSMVGPNTVTLTVTDVNGNVSMCTSVVTIVDTISPVAICQDLDIDLDATGNVSIVAADVDNGSTDACGIASIAIDVTDFDCSMVGPNTVTLTVTDVNGNTSTCTSVVTVNDRVDPIALCQDITVQLDATGNVSIVATQLDNGSTDACGIASYAADITDFDCSMIGANTVTLTVTDVNGNASTCTSTVTVVDTISPIASCQDITVFLDGAGMASIVAADLDNGSTDNCTTVSLAADITAFTCAEVGPNTVILTVTDGSGNTSTCTSTVTVSDTVSPIASCQDITVFLDGAGMVSIVAADLDNGSTDNCTTVTLAADITAFTCAETGPNTVTLTVTDGSGNTSTCTSTVTVLDTISPTASCQDITVFLDGAGMASIVAADLDNGSTDNCTSVTLAADITAFTCAEVGPNTVILTVTDASGNTSTCTSTVTVSDTVSPIASCQDITLFLDGAGMASIVAADIDNGSTDNCTTVTLAADITAFTCAEVGPNTVILTVTDGSGNTSTCTSTVTVTDTITPIITCPADVLVSNDPGLCSASSVAIGTAVATDNCTVSVTITNDAPAVFPVGVTVVTWTGVDPSGNSATCTQNVTVEDVENPIITCPADVTVGNDAGVCEATGVNLGTPTVTDNCTPPFSVTVTNNAPTVFPVGSTNVTWTATDSEGNIGTCTQIVTVEDTEAPMITCPSDVTVSTNPGICAAAGVTLGAPVTTDNCGVVSVTNDASGIFMLGSTTVTWTVTDAAGNSSTCTQIVTVEDTEAPVIACPIDVVVSSDAGSCDADALGVVLGTPITNDNCTVATVTNDAPSTYPLGNTTVTWTVTDAAGLTATCTQMVTVMDTENPTITCPIDVTVSADAGICDASAVVLGTPVTADNCTIASVTNDAPLTFPLGNTTVTWTVTDDAGNMATCTQVVTVEDTEAPMIVCPSDVTVSASGGICSASAVALGTPVTSDNCSIASITNDGLATYPLGATTVTWTIVDGSGNTSTCTQLVTVEDTELPSIACSADIIVSADAGSCDATGVVLISPVTNDNCSVANVSNDAPSAFPLGVTTVTWTVEDGSGNLNTCEQLVTVTDDEAPVITCPTDVTITADANSCNSTAVVLGTPVTDDNCSVASVSNDGLAIYPLGNTTVTWTVVDGSGNTSTCTQIVTVTDDEAPTITCPVDVTITADAGACASTVVVLGTPTTNDNCSVAAVTNDAPVVFPVGTTTVTWTVEDGSGNTTTCTQLVTVTDDEAPVVVCSPAVAANTDAGVCGATVTLTAPTALDNCGIATITNDAPVLFPVGMTTVTWTVTDIHGNVTTCTQDVDVTDTELPTVICTADVLVNNTPGYCGASVLYQTPIFDDNCGIVSVTQTDGSGYTTGNLFPVGTTYIEYTAVDNSGNVLTCGFNVTVVDNQMPTLTGCPADMTVYTTEAVQCEVVVNWTSPTAADNCPGVTMSQTAYSGSTFPLGMTTVTYDVTDNAGNTVSCSFNIEVLDVVHPTISMTDELTLVADDLMADSYQWVDCDNAYAPIVGETGSTYSATQNGNFAVIMTIDGCSDTTNCESITTVSLDEFDIEALVLYPNPTMDGHFKVQYSGQILQIDVIDMIGRLVSLPIDLNEGLVDGSELANGKYMVRVITEHGMIAKEVIVIK